MEIRGNAVAIRCLSDAIDGCGITRAELADGAAMSEPQLSKLTHHGAIALLDALPDAVVIPFLQRWGVERGFEVRAMLPAELDEEIVGLLDQLVALRRLRDVRTRQLKVSNVGAPVETRRRA